MYLHLIILFLIIVISSVLVILNDKPVIIEEFPGEDTVKALIKGATDFIMSPLNAAESAITSIENFVKNVTHLFGDLGHVVSDGFELLVSSIKLLGVVAQILFLIMDKMKSCIVGGEEVIEGMISQLNILREEMENTLSNVYTCVNLVENIDFKKTVKEQLTDYKNKCIINWDQSNKDLKNYIYRFREILENAKLFALKNDTSQGKSKEWCKQNFREGASFEYARQCNQCFNFYGLLSKGFSELAEVEVMVNKSIDFFKTVDDIVVTFKKIV